MASKRTTARPPRTARIRRAAVTPRRVVTEKRAARHIQRLHRNSPAQRPTVDEPEISRRHISLALIAVLAASAIAGIWNPEALSLWEKLLPLLGVMAGYYYGRLKA